VFEQSQDQERISVDQGLWSWEWHSSNFNCDI